VLRCNSVNKVALTYISALVGFFTYDDESDVMGCCCVHECSVAGGVVEE